MDSTPRYVHSPYSFEGMTLVKTPAPAAVAIQPKTTTATLRKSSLKDRMQPPPVAVGSELAAMNNSTPKNMGYSASTISPAHASQTNNITLAALPFIRNRMGLPFSSASAEPSPANSSQAMSSTRSSYVGFVPSFSDESGRMQNMMFGSHPNFQPLSNSTTPTNRSTMGPKQDPYASMSSTPTNSMMVNQLNNKMGFFPSPPVTPNNRLGPHHMYLVQDLIPSSPNCNESFNLLNQMSMSMPSPYGCRPPISPASCTQPMEITPATSPIPVAFVRKGTAVLAMESKAHSLVAPLCQQPVEDSCDECSEDEEDGCETHLRGPCPHTTKWKRLRAKRGYGYYVCLLCGAKWKTTSAARRAASAAAAASAAGAACATTGGDEAKTAIITN